MGWASVPVIAVGYRDDVIGGEREVHDVLAGQRAEHRRLVERDAAAGQHGDQVKQAECRDAGRAGLLPQGDVVALRVFGWLVLLGRKPAVIAFLVTRRNQRSSSGSLLRRRWHNGWRPGGKVSLPGPRPCASSGQSTGRHTTPSRISHLALRAAGAHPQPSLALLAYAAANIVALIPLTPGGLGIVEADLASLPVLAGVPSGPAFVATLAYRLVSYWLPVLIGGPAHLMFRHRYGAAWRRSSAHQPTSSYIPDVRSRQGCATL